VNTFRNGPGAQKAEQQNKKKVSQRTDFANMSHTARKTDIISPAENTTMTAAVNPSPGTPIDIEIEKSQIQGLSTDESGRVGGVLDGSGRGARLGSGRSTRNLRGWRTAGGLKHPTVISIPSLERLSRFREADGGATQKDNPLFKCFI
jgi:hypothetical protein